MTEPAPEPAEAPARPALPRKLRASAARTALLASAAADTGDAPGTPAATAPEAAVAVLEAAPELTWHRTFFDVTTAKFDRWHAAVPRPPITPVPAAELPPPPPLPVSPQPVGLTQADREFLAKNAAIGTDPGEGMGMRRERVFGPLDAWLGAARKPVPHGAPMAGAVEPAPPAPPAPVLAVKEQHHEEPGTGPQAWANYGELERADTMVLELGEADCADVEPPDIPF